MLKFTDEQLQIIEDLLIDTSFSFEVAMRSCAKQVYEDLYDRENINWCECCRKWYQWDEVCSENNLCYDCLDGEPLIDDEE